MGWHSLHSALSLELMGILILDESYLDMPALKSLKFGRFSFSSCTRAVFESE